MMQILAGQAKAVALTAVLSAMAIGLTALAALLLSQVTVNF
jgi:hypothetical protein